jgi:hypothetical protein
VTARISGVAITSASGSYCARSEKNLPDGDFQNSTSRSPVALLEIIDGRPNERGVNMKSKSSWTTVWTQARR